MMRTVITLTFSQFVVIYLFIFKNGSPGPHITNQVPVSDLANAHRNLGHLSFQYLGSGARPRFELQYGYLMCKVWTRAGLGLGHFRPRDGFCACGSTSLHKHASSLRPSLRHHRLAIDAHSLVISISRHTSPQTSLLTTLGSPRAANTTVARSLEDGEVGPSTSALSDRIVIYGFHTLSYVHRLFFYQNTRSPSSLP